MNLVSVGLLLLALAAGYAGWKIGPVYWNSHKVGEIVRGVAIEANGINMMGRDSQNKLEKRILTRLKERIGEERGITDAEHGLEVYFDEEFDALHAEYDVVVELPFGKRFTRHFDVVSDVSAGISP